MKLQPAAFRIAVTPVDMRLGADGLSLLVQQVLGCTPCDRTAYVLSNRRRTRVKLVCWDGNGVWLCQRRLHRGHFIWPQSGDAVCELSDEQWQWLVAGIDWQRLSAAAPAPADWQFKKRRRFSCVIGTPALLTDGQRVNLLAKLVTTDISPALLEEVRVLLTRVELAERNAQLLAAIEDMLQKKESIIEAKESINALQRSLFLLDKCSVLPNDRLHKTIYTLKAGYRTAA